MSRRMRRANRMIAQADAMMSHFWKQWHISRNTANLTKLRTRADQLYADAEELMLKEADAI